MRNPRLNKLRGNEGLLRVVIVLLILSIITSVGLLIPILGLRFAPPAETAAQAETADTAADGETDTSASEAEATASTEATPAAGETEGQLTAPTLDSSLASEALAGEELALTGTGEPGSEVEIVANDEVIGTTTVADDGTWSLAYPFSDPGDYDLQVRTVDADGTMVNESEPFALSIAAPDLALPTFDLPSLDLDNLFAGQETELSGMGEPGSEVEIVANDEVIGTTTVADDGTWSLAYPFSEPGDYDLQVRTLDTDGEMVNESEPFALSIAAPELALPTFDLPNLDLGNLFAGQETELTGTGEPGSEVEIVANDEVIGTTTVDDDGTWSLAYPFSDPGDYNLQVRTLDADGEMVNESEPFALSIAAPDLALPTFDLPNLDLGNLFAGQETELSGTGEPGSEVELVANGEVISTTTVADDGTWSLAYPFSEPGDYDLQVRTLDASGSVVNESNTLSLSIAPSELTLPTLDLTALDLDNLSTDEEATLSGTGEPGSEVEVVANGEVISTTTVDDEGNWRLAYLFSESGDYELQVRTLDADGAVVNESEPVSLSVTTTGDATSEEAPTLAEPELEEVITDEAINLAGTGEPGGEVQVLANDDLFGVAPVEEDGTWEYAVAFSEPGDYDLTVRTVDADGNITSTSEAVSVSIAAPSPSETFAFIFPADGADIISGQLTIIGTANAGQEIEVLEGATVLGTAETSGNGEWFFIFEPEDGNHTYTARLASQTSRSIGPIAVRVVSASGEVDCSSNLGISRGDNYIVGTCNTFGTVIERTGVGLDALIEANPQIPNPDLIYPGDVINVPR